MINFEEFLNFEDFLTDPAATLKAAQRKVEEAVEEEERQLKAKAAQQEEESKAAYQRAITALKQQYNELREVKGLNTIEQTISEQAAKINSVVSSLEQEVQTLKAQVEEEKSKRIAAEESIKDHNENLSGESKTGKISTNLENKYGINVAEAAAAQGIVLNDNEEYEDLKEIVDTARLEEFDRRREELENNFQNPNQTKSTTSNFGYGDFASVL